MPPFQPIQGPQTGKITIPESSELANSTTFALNPIIPTVCGPL